MKREYRVHPGLELRQESGERVRISGYAAVFNQLSERMMFFRERIKPGAFSKSMKNDIRAFNNHEQSQPIGRTKNGTLTLREDAKGLWVDIFPPNTAAGHDVIENIRTGLVDQMSFGFTIESKDHQKFTEENGEEIRELLQINLMEVSPVAIPAYAGTSIGVRCLWPDGVPEDFETLRTSKPVVVVPVRSNARKLLEELEEKYGIKRP